MNNHNFFSHRFIGYSSCKIQYKFIIQHKKNKKRKEKKQKPKRSRCNGTNVPCEVKEDVTPFPACFADETYYQTCLSRDPFRSRWTPSRKDNAISSFFAKIPCYLCTVSIRKQNFNSPFLGFLF